MSRDNAGLRILSPRATTQGHDSSLRNTYGVQLLDGAQCFVIAEEANYRFLKHSVLHPDGRFVVEPIDRSGRWVRESGTFGAAILKGGKPQNSDPLLIGEYTPLLLVQFALNGSKVVYTGNTSRLACVAAGSASGHNVTVDVERGDEWIPLPPHQPVFLLNPGDCLVLRTEHPVSDSLGFSLVVALG